MEQDGSCDRRPSGMILVLEGRQAVVATARSVQRQRFC